MAALSNCMIFPKKGLRIAGILCIIVPKFFRLEVVPVEKMPMIERAMQPEAVLRSVDYLAEKMRVFLRKGDRVLICFADDGKASLGRMFADAAQRCGANAIFWGPDLRWITLLRLAFTSRASVIIAPPLVTLGLAKLARAKGTPLYIHNVVTAGYPCANWMIDGLINTLDCKTWGCLDLHGLIAGFSCKAGRGVHIRQEEYTALILDADGNPLPDGQVGELYICRTDDPTERFAADDLARIDTGGCSCGCATPRLMDIAYGRSMDPELMQLGELISQWTSVLDCRLKRGPLGLEIEIVVFPGEKLPQLPSCAKLVVRPWDPEHDCPFWTTAVWKNPYIPFENH